MNMMIDSEIIKAYRTASAYTLQALDIAIKECETDELLKDQARSLKEAKCLILEDVECNG